MKNPIGYWLMATALSALALPLAINAQQGGRGAPANKPAPTSPFTGNAVAGKKLFYSYGCYACHGYSGETGIRPLGGTWGHLGTEQEFITFLRGRVNVAPVIPSGSMPNFSAGSLPDNQAKDIYAYIRTFKSTAPVGKDPTLSAIVEAAKQEKN